MPEYLTFTLYAPIAAFGAPAVGERRGSYDRPTRSAVLGLVGACLGIERTDGDALDALQAQYGLALHCQHHGRLLVDFHTAQVPSTKRGRRFATRREELTAATLNTVLSRRDYRTDAWHLAALWARADAQWSLQALHQALMTPRFLPYLGRKSCPLGLPLAPRIGVAPDPIAALTERNADAGEAVLRAALVGAATGPALVAMDLDEAQHCAPERIQHVEQRRDVSLSRARWQFGLRAEALVSIP
jgi:CRISPR system Cascade subunit CasD